MRHAIVRFGSLGDCVLLYRLILALRRGGSSHVCIVTRERYGELFASMRGVDRVVCLGEGAGAGTLIRIGADLRRGGYCVIDAHNNLRSLVLSLGMRRRPPTLRKYYWRRIALILFKHSGSIPTMAERFEGLADRGRTENDYREHETALKIPESIEEWSNEVAGEDKEFIALAPGSKWPMKRWGDEKYLALARSIVDRFARRIILLGGEEDRMGSVPFDGFAGRDLIDLRGGTSILQAASLLSRARALVTNDSGLLHLAEAMNTPVVAIFGPTVERFGYYPLLADSKVCERSLHCRPCSKNGARRCPLGTRECMEGIPVEAVEEVLDDLLRGRGPRRYLLP